MIAPRRVLIVDDDPSLRMVLKVALETWNDVEVIEAADGFEALDLIEKFSPDAAVIDLLMPNMDGSVLLRKLRFLGDPESLPKVLVMTALEQSLEGHPLAEQLAAYRVLKKPFHIEEFFEAVEDVIGPANQ